MSICKTLGYFYRSLVIRKQQNHFYTHPHLQRKITISNCMDGKYAHFLFMFFGGFFPKKFAFQEKNYKLLQAMIRNRNKIRDYSVKLNSCAYKNKEYINKGRFTTTPRTHNHIIIFRQSSSNWYHNMYANRSNSYTTQTASHWIVYAILSHNLIIVNGK